jgi:hypothetical protein
LLLGGGIVTGVGVLNLLSVGFCATSSLSSDDTKNLCFGLALGAGGVCLAIGIPMLIVGANQHAAYERWLKRHPLVYDLSVVPVRGGGAIGWSANF